MDKMLQALKTHTVGKGKNGGPRSQSLEMFGEDIVGRGEMKGLRRQLWMVGPGAEDYLNGEVKI